MRYCFIALLFLYNVATAQTISYRTGTNNWNADSLGNHRFVINIKADAFARNKAVAHVVIPWRRHDEEVANKRMKLVAENGKAPVDNIKILSADNDTASILFEPIAGAGNYYLYYMPYKNEGRSNYPKGTYLKPVETAHADWLKQTLLKRTFAKATATAYETIN